MSSSVSVHRLSLDELQIFDAKEWRDDLLQRHRDGSRLLTLFGKCLNDRVIVTSAFRHEAGAIEATRASVTTQTGYHELTSEVPALHCFERELHEQTGIRIAGNPWLKPIRFERRPRAEEPFSMDAYPFYKIEGKEVHEVAVGPIHAGVIEPGAFRFMCHGEQVHHLEIHLGYQHRGVEQRLLEGDARRLTPLVETICGDSSVAHAWAYCAALESLSGCDIDAQADVARAVALELERVAMHLGSLSGLAADIGFLQGATTYGRLRTTAINTTMRLCGSRFGRGALRPGGIGMQLTPDLHEHVEANIDQLLDDLAIINECFLESKTVQHRLQGVGILSAELASQLGLVGPAARASGISVDARKDVKDGAYNLVPIELQVRNEGDCWARAQIRIGELNASLRWLKRILGTHKNWSHMRKPIVPLASKQLAIAVVEGFRGEVVHCLETNDEGKLAHYKVQDPSFRNWMGLAIAVRGNEISDFPICNKSFDLSYCGSDL